MNMKQLKEKLEGVADAVSRNKAGNYVARLEFFYRNGGTADSFAACVLKAVPGAVILNKWETWKPFRGGASTANSSHWGVEFQVPAAAEAQQKSSLTGSGAAV